MTYNPTLTHTQNKMKEGSIKQEHLRPVDMLCVKIKTSTSNAELVKYKRVALPHHLCFPMPLAFQWGWERTHQEETQWKENASNTLIWKYKHLPQGDTTTISIELSTHVTILHWMWLALNGARRNSPISIGQEPSLFEMFDLHIAVSWS